MFPKVAVLTVLLMISYLGYSQGEEDPTFTIVEVMPVFPGGTDSLLQYVGRNIKYPPEAREKGIQGIVYILKVG